MSIHSIERKKYQDCYIYLNPPSKVSGIAVAIFSIN